ncbi:hypothetical protein E2C01_091863 [Portunus trituberculatus]|uniref:Uncharacterized protein n=1 Tax=Portunus trituberculatus TaxID=210409 RepID=A0A5B7JQI9_PORTR|nr:hypothetical protein [Portunus trituberculatus]
MVLVLPEDRSLILPPCSAEYPNAIPKKPSGPRELPVVLRGSTSAVGVDGPVRVKLEPPRQQYL